MKSLCQKSCHLSLWQTIRTRLWSILRIYRHYIETVLRRTDVLGCPELACWQISMLEAETGAWYPHHWSGVERDFGVGHWQHPTLIVVSIWIRLGSLFVCLFYWMADITSRFCNPNEVRFWDTGSFSQESYFLVYILSWTTLAELSELISLSIQIGIFEIF